MSLASPSRALWRGGALSLAVALVVLWPGFLHPTDQMIGDEGLDVWSHAWGIRWIFNALMDGQLPWDVDGLAWPRGGVLWYIDPLGAAVSLPAQALFGTAAGHNSILLVQVVLAAFGGWGFARALGGHGWLAGVALGTAPTFLAEIHNGTVEACWIGTVALAGWAATRNRWYAGALVGLAALATPYHGISAAILVGTILLLSPEAEGDPPVFSGRVQRCLKAAALAAVVALPAFLILKASLDDPMGIAKKPTILLNYPVFRINAVDPIAFFYPGDFWTVKLTGADTTPFRRTPYLGLGLLCLAPFALARRPRRAWWGLPVLVLATLALGPFLWHDGDFVRTSSGDLLALPFRWVLTGLGTPMDHPLRFVGGAVVVLAALADVGLGVLTRNRAPLFLAGAALIGVEHLLLAPSVWPINTAEAGLPAIYADLNEPGAVIDLPAARGQSIATNRYLYWQALHRHPVPYSHKVGPDLPSVNQALRNWANLSRTNPESIAPRATTPPASKIDLADLSRTGFRWVVFHPELAVDNATRDAHVSALTIALGKPTEVDGDLRWRLLP